MKKVEEAMKLERRKWARRNQGSNISVLEPIIHLGEVSGQRVKTGCGFVEKGC